jgi:hypothetical protein
VYCIAVVGAVTAVVIVIVVVVVVVVVTLLGMIAVVGQGLFGKGLLALGAFVDQQMDSWKESEGW